MRTQPIGTSDLFTTRLAYGCMRIAGTWNPDEITPARREAAHKAIITAYEAGYTLFDHADIYCRGGCETLHGEVLADVKSMRDEIVIATKCGIRFKDDPVGEVGRYDFSYDHIIKSCELSLKRLQIETVDIYQLHRPDLLMNPEEVAEAFSVLKSQGKVKYFGVSNFSPSFVQLLQDALDLPLIVNQIEVHLGFLDPFVDGTLDQCIRAEITPLSWSPLGGGWLGGKDAPEDPKKAELVKTMDEVAHRYNTDRAGIALAWLLKHPSKIVPIVGSANPERIKQAVAAESIDISREDWYRLLVAARGKPMP
jgi:predicted oxidoreductase